MPDPIVDEPLAGRWRRLWLHAAWVVVVASTIVAGASMGVGLANPTARAECVQPGAPGNLTATVAPADDLRRDEVKLTWDAPTGQVSHYTIEQSLDGSTWTNLGIGSARTTSTVRNRAAGTTYQFRVAARPMCFEVCPPPCQSPWTTVGVTTPAWAPAAPSGLTATVQGRGEVKLAWTAPASFGWRDDDYAIEWTLDGTTWTSFQDGASTDTTYTARGLTNHKVYMFRVAATFPGWASGPWSTVRSTLPPLPPTAPTKLAAAVAPAAGVGSGEVKLAWTAPGDDGGSAINTYVIQLSNDGMTWTDTQVTPTGTTATAKGLTNGTTYWFRVAAKNSLNLRGDPSSSVAAKPVWRPAAPTSLKASLTDTPGGREDVKLSWPAAVDNGSPITGYLIERSPLGGEWSAVTDVSWSTPTEAVVHGSTKGTLYQFRVSAQNALGSGRPVPRLSAGPKALRMLQVG